MNAIAITRTPAPVLAFGDMAAWDFEDVRIILDKKNVLWYSQQLDAPANGRANNVTRRFVDEFLGFFGTNTDNLIDTLE